MCTVHVVLRRGEASGLACGALACSSETIISPEREVWVAELERMTDCIMPQLFRKTQRPYLRKVAPLMLSAGRISTFSCTTNLSPKGTSCEIEERCSTIAGLPGGPSDGCTRTQIVTVILVVRGHIGAGGTGTCISASRTLVTASLLLSPPPASSIQGFTIIPVAPRRVKCSFRRQPGFHSPASRSAAMGPTGRSGMLTSIKLRKGSPSENTANALDEAEGSLDVGASSSSSFSSSPLSWPSWPSSPWMSAAMAAEPASQLWNSTDARLIFPPLSCRGCFSTSVATSRVSTDSLTLTSATATAKERPRAAKVTAWKQMWPKERYR
mmetsp:Transcript_38431/g.122137  ORF Transcript_38431/g.122137 Transcript_38431/m.122137 type:complete len:325 (+) Transcript_38431:419-1393(+)